MTQATTNPSAYTDNEAFVDTRRRVLLADDNPLLLVLLQDVLAGEFNVVGVATDGVALVKEYVRLQPDVVVTDISMPIMNGFAAAEALREAGNPPVVFLTVHEDAALVEEARALGASGYVLKRSRPAILVEAIRSAFGGEFFLCPELRSQEDPAGNSSRSA